MPPSVVRADSAGTEILKIPVGTDLFVADRLQRRVGKMKAITDELENIEDLHVEFTLLQACLGSTRLAYSLRSRALRGGTGRLQQS